MSEGIKKFHNLLKKTTDLGVQINTLCANVKGVFRMPRLSKKAKREWNFFISSKTGRRTYNDLCRKCSNTCKQSFRAIVVSCPKYRSKRSSKNIPNSNKFNNSS